MKKINKNKILPISLLVIFFIITIIAISSIKVYSVYKNSKDTNETNNSVKTENIENEEKQEQEEQKLEEQEEQEPTKVYTFTADNGQTYDMIGTLKIPSLNIEYPILANYTEDLLKVSVTKYWGGNPNKVGNLCILGHNYKNSKFFSKLPNIQKDAIVEITDLDGKTLEYKVYETSIIDPDDMSCTSQLTNGHTEVTLITCYYENPTGKATKRFVAKARAN